MRAPKTVTPDQGAVTKNIVATLAILSDTHLAKVPVDNEYSPDRGLRQAVEAMLPYKPDMALLLGDVTEDGSLEACLRVKQIVDELGAPIIAIPGNHDRPVDIVDVFGSVHDTTMANWRIVAVDTTIPNQIHGCINSEEVLAVLGADIGQPTVLAMHHPPITTSSHPWFQLKGAVGLITALTQRSDIRLVVTGHIHQAFHVVLGAITYIGCSSTWYSIDHHGEARKDDNGHTGGLVMHLYQDGTFDWQRVSE